MSDKKINDIVNITDTAGESEGLTEKDMVTVPYFVYEAAQSRSERNVNFLVKVVIIALVLLFLSNALWLWAWFQYDYESYTIESHDGGHANYIGNDGDIYNGESESKETNQEEQQGT